MEFLFNAEQVRHVYNITLEETVTYRKKRNSIEIYASIFVMHMLRRIIHDVSFFAASTSFIDVIHLKDIFIN